MIRSQQQQEEQESNLLLLLVFILSIRISSSQRCRNLINVVSLPPLSLSYSAPPTFLSHPPSLYLTSIYGRHENVNENGIATAAKQVFPHQHKSKRIETHTETHSRLSHTQRHSHTHAYRQSGSQLGPAAQLYREYATLKYLSGQMEFVTMPRPCLSAHWPLPRLSDR